LYPSTSEIFYHMGVGRLSDLLRISITFKSLKKEIQVGKLIMSACIVKVTSLQPTTITYNTELMTNQPCDESLLINNNTYQKSFEMTLEDVYGKTYPDACQALRYNVVGGFHTRAPADELYIMNFTLLDTCSDNWEIATIYFRTTYVTEVQLYVGKMVKHTWTFKDIAEMNYVATEVGQTVVGNVIQLNFQAIGGMHGGIFRIEDLCIELFCSCSNVTSLHPTTETYNTVQPTD